MRTAFVTWLWLALVGSSLPVAHAHGNHGHQPTSPYGYAMRVWHPLAHTPPTPTTEAALAYLAQQFPALAQAPGTWTLADERTSPLGIHRTFELLHQGRPLLNSQLRTHHHADGRLYGCSFNQTYADHPPTTAAWPDSQAARAKVLDELGGHLIRFRAVWAPWQGELRPAWQAWTFMDRHHTSHEVVLDALTGQELYREDRARYFRDSTCRDTSAPAYVYLPDPLTTAGVYYGGNYVDNNDSTNPSLDSQRVAVTLHNICFDTSAQLFRLNGPWCRIVDTASPFKPPVTATQPDFRFNRFDDGFEAANAYFHIDSMQRYLRRLGYTNLVNYPIATDVHAEGGADQSRFVGNGENSLLYFGEGCVDDAEDADVIVHEYTHAISHSAAPFTSQGIERIGVDEGYADYFAASRSQVWNSFRWADIFTWDGHNLCFAGRTADVTTYSYCDTELPGRLAIIYEYGQLLATAMMRVWPELGPEATDRLVIGAMSYQQNNMTLLDFAQNVLTADTILNGGANGRLITNALASVCLAESLTVSLDPNAPTAPWQLHYQPTEQRLLVAPPNGFSRTYTASIVDLRGRTVKQWAGLRGPLDRVLPNGLAVGMYWVRIEADPYTLTRRLWVRTP